MDACCSQRRSSANIADGLLGDREQKPDDAVVSSTQARTDKREELRAKHARQNGGLMGVMRSTVFGEPDDADVEDESAPEAGEPAKVEDPANTAKEKDEAEKINAKRAANEKYLQEQQGFIEQFDNIMSGRFLFGGKKT